MMNTWWNEAGFGSWCHSVTLEFEKGSRQASRVLLLIYLFISLCFTLKEDHTFFSFLELQFPTIDMWNKASWFWEHAIVALEREKRSSWSSIIYLFHYI